VNRKLRLPAESIRTGADPVLHRRAGDVALPGPTAPLAGGADAAAAVGPVLARMRRSMAAAQGIGLAAPQIGLGLRILVWAVPHAPPGWEMGGPPRGELINGRLVSTSSDTSVLDEGCLSLPGVTVTLERPAAVVVAGFDAGLHPVRLELSGIVARVVLHELDHLEGALIVDRRTGQAH
jgi:peptide deformylase